MECNFFSPSGPCLAVSGFGTRRVLSSVITDKDTDTVERTSQHGRFIDAISWGEALHNHKLTNVEMQEKKKNLKCDD